MPYSLARVEDTDIYIIPWFYFVDRKKLIENGNIYVFIENEDTVIIKCKCRIMDYGVKKWETTSEQELSKMFKQIRVSLQFSTLKQESTSLICILETHNFFARRFGRIQNRRN